MNVCIGWTVKKWRERGLKSEPDGAEFQVCGGRGRNG